MRPRDFDPIPEVGEDGDDEFNAPKFQHTIGGKVYVDDNNDRFGLPIRPMKPIQMIPGPGAYFPEGEGGEYNLANKSFPIEPARQFSKKEHNFKKEVLDAGKNQGVPGPAYYKNPNKEP